MFDPKRTHDVMRKEPVSARLIPETKMFIILLNYIKPIAEVEAVFPAHCDYLERYYQLDKFVLSGRKNPRTGGVILCQARDKDEVWAIISEDPFYREQVAGYEVLEFLPTKAAAGLSRYLKEPSS